MKTFLVQLVNHTDSRDNEARRVKAESIEAAKELLKYLENRFSIGVVVPARGGTVWERAMARELRAICCG